MANKPTYEELEQRVLELEKTETERKQLEEPEERLKAMSEASFEAIFLSEKGICFDQNQTAKKMFGYTRAEAIGRHGTVWIVPNDHEQVKINMASGYEKPYEVTALKKDGDTFPAEIQARMTEYQGRSIRITALRDISDRKQAEEALSESEEKYKSLTNNLNVGVYRNSVGSKGKFIEANPAIVKMFGYDSREEFLKIGVSDLYKDPLERKEFTFKIAEAGSIKNEILELQKKDGTGFIGSISAVAVKNKKGDIKYFDGIIEDITERKWAEESLRKSHKRYQLIVENISNVVWTMDMNFHNTFVSPSVYQQRGYTPEEVKNQPLSARMTPNSIEKVLNLYNKKLKLIEDGDSEGWKATEFEIEQPCKDGSTIWTTNTVRFLPGPDKQPASLLGTTHDITDRKRSEVALLESEEKFRLISEQSLMAIVIVQDDRIKYANQAYMEMTGYTWEEIMNWTMRDIVQAIHPDDLPFVMEQGRKKAAGISDGVVTRYAYRGFTKSGEVRWIDQYSKTITYMGKPADLLTFIDIHNQKLTQETLIQSEKRYRDLADSLPQIVFETDENGNLTFVNRNAFDIFGYSQNDFDRGINTLEVLIPEDRKRAMENMQRLMNSGSPGANEYTALRKDGCTFPISIHSNALIYENKFLGFRGIIIDLTQTKKAEEALRESEEKYRSLVESTQDSIYVVNRNCAYLFMNKRHLSRLEVPEDNATGKTYREFHSASDTQEFVKKVEEVFASDAPLQHEHESHRDGKHFLRTLSPVIGPDGRTEAVTVVSTDITDRVQAEEERLKLQDQLQHAQKMEAIGTLAGGVAHDLNNILGGLVSYPELLLLQLPEDSPLRKSILTIQKSGEKAAAVVQDLLTLARRGVVVTEVVNLNDIIAQYLESSEHERLQSYHPGVHLETHLDQNTLNIMGSPIHLSKTVMNLVSNAAEAMPEGGALTVSTENRYIDKPIRGHDHVKEGDYVVLTISDTGTGIASDDLDKIFEPFYTKKKMGRSGTGLGMAVVWGTVKDHSGYIHVQSTEGKGTTFTLYFPVTRKSLEERSNISLKDYMGKGEAILVVDDVEEQRQIASGMLKELGYSVVSVPSGEEAVEYLKTNKVNLLVLDMIMDPGMDGFDTYKKIIEIHPGQKAIIASGFSETDRVKKLQHLGAGAYIKKPFLLEKIGLAVKEELGQ
jgi:PAS domain S-box-containing protein